MTFQSFFFGGVAVALHLPAQVLEDIALGSADESSTDSALVVWTKIMKVHLGPLVDFGFE
jgi:hypothetical protein